MNEKEYGDKAAGLFAAGYSCAQAVFAAFAEEYGMDQETALKVSSGLGGGVGRLRETCGCVTGAALALGLKYGGNPETKAAVYEKVQALAAQFKEENGSIVCRELLAGVPKTTTGGAPEARTPEYYKKRPCGELVRRTAEILAQL